jgi:hypothetical protein
VPASASTSEIRAWARAHGFDVSDRGRLPADVRAAWEAARNGAGAWTTAPDGAVRDEAADDRLSAIEELLTLVDERLHTLEDQVGALAARVTALEGKRKRAAILRRRDDRG